MPSEFDAIDQFTRRFRVPLAPLGPGDDCAVIDGKACVTTDAVVEGVHFTRKTFSLEDVGYKALAVNLSDLAAMGATPRWFVCALALPDPTEVDALSRGMAPLARRAGIALIGGNVTRSPVLSITITAAGEANKPLLRSGGRAKDLLYVSGTLGDAALGVSTGSLKQRRPQPRLLLGLLAAKFARAAIDISDGLAQDLGHLCEASRVGAQVDVTSLPLSAAVKRHAHGRDLALSGGEDYELLLAVPPSRAAAFERAAKNQVTRIGHLTAGRAVRFVEDGVDVRPTRGFDHFG
ncbi:MAG: thiamine-phosphate kinase [Myxococcaceae bacterium]